MRPLNTLVIRACFVALSTAVASPGPALSADAPDVRAVLAAPAVAAGGSMVPLTVTMTIGPGWHVNSHLPSEAYIIPTGVMLSSSAGALSPVRYPGDIVRRLAFDEKPLRLYEGVARFAADLALPAAAGGTVSILGRVTYQACNDRQCFPPVTIELAASVRIGSGADSHTGRKLNGHGRKTLPVVARLVRDPSEDRHRAAGRRRQRQIRCEAGYPFVEAERLLIEGQAPHDVSRISHGRKRP